MTCLRKSMISLPLRADQYQEIDYQYGGIRYDDGHRTGFDGI